MMDPNLNIIIYKLMLGKWKSFILKLRNIYNILAALQMVREDFKVTEIGMMIMDNLEYINPGFDLQRNFRQLYISTMAFMILLKFWFKKDVTPIDVMDFIIENTDEDVEFKRIMEEEIENNMNDNLIFTNRRQNDGKKFTTEI
jgi:hypothetical protein